MSRKDWHRPENGTFSVKEGFRRIAIEVAYNGQNYNGWQLQASSDKTVQKVLEDALFKMIKTHVNVQGSGRTDSGVHAMGQVAHFDIPSTLTIPASAFEHLSLPKDVKVTRAWEAEKDFHSRFSAMAREYRYFIKLSSQTSPFERDFVASVRKNLDLQLLNEYAAIIKGTHDFSAFCGAGDLSLSKCRDIYESQFTSLDGLYGGSVIMYKIVGNAFLYHMVRSLVGTMIELAKINAPASEFEKILLSKDRSLALKTADSCGLYLWRICFDENEYQWFEEQSGR